MFMFQFTQIVIIISMDGELIDKRIYQLKSFYKLILTNLMFTNSRIIVIYSERDLKRQKSTKV